MRRVGRWSRRWRWNGSWSESLGRRTVRGRTSRRRRRSREEVKGKGRKEKERITTKSKAHDTDGWMGTYVSCWSGKETRNECVKTCLQASERAQCSAAQCNMIE